MPATEALVEQQDFSAGMQPDVARHLIDPRGAYDIVNGFVDDDGSAYERGGTINKTIEAFGSKVTFLWDGFLLPGRRTVGAHPTAFGVLDSADTNFVSIGGGGMAAPKRAAEINEILFLDGGYLYGGSRKTANYSTGTVAVTQGSKTVTKAAGGLSANVDAGMLMQIGGAGRVYVVASVDSDTSLTLRDAYEGSTNGTASFVFHRVFTATSPYVASSYYGVCGNRLLAVSGNKLLFSDIDNPHNFPTNNNHEFPQGSRLLGTATLGDTAVVFATSGLWMVNGLAVEIVDDDGNPQHQVEHISGDIILFGHAGIASFESQLIAPALDGIWMVSTYGAAEEISHPIESKYREYVKAGYKPGGAVVHRSHYYLPILDSSNATVDVLVCRLDRPVRSRGRTTYPWTRLGGTGSQISCYVQRVSDPTPSPVLLAGDNASYTEHLLDNFSVNNLADYIFDSGSGTLTVAGGVLSPTATGTRKRFVLDKLLLDQEVVYKYTTPSSMSTSEVGAQLKRLDGLNHIYVRAYPQFSQIEILKYDGGSFTSLANTGITINASTTYWLRAKIEGNKITLQHWTTDPDLGGSPANTLTHTLAGANATKFGEGVEGRAGFHALPASTDWTYDDLRVRSPRARVLDCSEYVAPDALHAHDADYTDKNLKIITRDFPTGPAESSNVVRKLRSRYELVDPLEEDPVLKCDYSTGVSLPGTAVWGQFNWGAGVWSSTEDSEFQNFGEDGPESGGENLHSFHLNKSLRFVRFRLRSSGRCAKLNLRSLRLHIRPSRTIRR